MAFLLVLIYMRRVMEVLVSTCYSPMLTWHQDYAIEFIKLQGLVLFWERVLLVVLLTTTTPLCTTQS